MENALIVVALLALVGLAVFGTVRRIRRGSSCCGTRTPAEKKVAVRDRNKKNYPFVYNLLVDGMYCSNCARRIENAFHSGEGRWAKADIGRREVILRSKKAESEREIAAIAAQAGYTLIAFREEQNGE